MSSQAPGLYTKKLELLQCCEYLRNRKHLLITGLHYVNSWWFSATSLWYILYIQKYMDLATYLHKTQTTVPTCLPTYRPTCIQTCIHTGSLYITHTHTAWYVSLETPVQHPFGCAGSCHIHEHLRSSRHRPTPPRLQPRNTLQHGKKETSLLFYCSCNWSLKCHLAARKSTSLPWNCNISQ